jgi:hypothetical protein
MNRLNEYLKMIMETREVILKEISSINPKQVAFDFSVDEEYNINELIIYLITNDDLNNLSFVEYRFLDEVAEINKRTFKSNIKLFIKRIQTTENGQNFVIDSYCLEKYIERKSSAILNFSGLINHNVLELNREKNKKIFKSWVTDDFKRVYNQILDDYEEITGDNVKNMKLFDKSIIDERLNKFINKIQKSNDYNLKKAILESEFVKKYLRED